MNEIEPGVPANPVLLDGNPLTDISNTNKISAVVIRGHLLARRDPGRLLDRVARAARGH